MPIRVPQIVSQQGLDLGGTPQIPAGAGSETYGALTQAAAQINKALADYTHVNDQLSKQDMKLDVDSKLTQLRDRLAEEDVNLRGEGLEPDQQPEEFRTRGQKVISEVAQDLHYPQSAGEFQVKAQQILGQQVIESRYRALKTKDARIGVLADIASQDDANLAINGATPEIRDGAVRNFMERVKDLTGSQVWSQDKAATWTTKFLTQVGLGRARIAASNPETRLDTIGALMRGEVRNVPWEAQRELADQLLKQGELAQKDADRRAADAAKDDKEEAMREWTIAAMNGARPPADLLTELDQIARRHRLTDTEYARGHHILTQPAAKNELESDPATLRAVIADTHSMRPKMSEAQLNTLFDQGKLNMKDWKSALDRRRETLEANRREGQSLVMQQHAQAEQELAKHVCIVTPFSQLDKTQEKLAGEVLTELRRRSNAYPGGTEPPLKVLEELIPRVRNTLASDARFNKQELERQLTYFSTKKLDADRRLGLITEGFYRSEQDRLIRWNDYVKKEEQNTAQPKPQGATPTPQGGTTNSLGRPR